MQAARRQSGERAGGRQGRTRVEAWWEVSSMEWGEERMTRARGGRGRGDRGDCEQCMGNSTVLFCSGKGIVLFVSHLYVANIIGRLFYVLI